MDPKYTLIPFALELIFDLGLEIIEVVSKDIISMTEDVSYYFMQDTYYYVYNQLPPNAIQARDAANNIYHHTVSYIQQDANSSIIAINILAFGLHIITLINAFVVILNLLITPRTGGPGGY